MTCWWHGDLDAVDDRDQMRAGGDLTRGEGLAERDLVRGLGGRLVVLQLESDDIAGVRRLR